jgi:hypothetical protein
MALLVLTITCRREVLSKRVNTRNADEWGRTNGTVNEVAEISL